jgi:acyl carrier protein
MGDLSSMPGASKSMSIEALITAQFEQVAQEQNKTLAALKPETMLIESGLDSLCMAIIVARLEDALGVDPFAAAEDVDFPVTFGDFVKFYENAAAK